MQLVDSHRRFGGTSYFSKCWQHGATLSRFLESSSIYFYAIEAL
jgi:hypothetical protein